MILAVNSAATALIDYGCEELRQATDLVLCERPADREQMFSNLGTARKLDHFSTTWVNTQGESMALRLDARVLVADSIRYVLLRVSGQDGMDTNPIGFGDVEPAVARPAAYGEFTWDLQQDTTVCSPRCNPLLGLENSADLQGTATQYRPQIEAIFNTSPTPVLIPGSSAEDGIFVIIAANPAACRLLQ